MASDNTMTHVITRRKSVRSYQSSPLDADLIHQVEDSAAQSTPLFPEINLRFITIEDGPAFIRKHGGALQSYGRILGAPHYLAAVSETRAGYMINTGFRMEQMILHATSLGLGTCWLGGAYRRQDVGEMLGIAQEEQVVALTPLGMPANGMRTIVNRAIKLMTPGRGKRLPLEELLFTETWGMPVGDVLNDRPALHQMIEAARMAPSWVNSQPWRFVLRSDELIVAVSRPAGQNELPYYLLDGGIAMSHIHLVAEELELSPAWEIDSAMLERQRVECNVPAEFDLIGALKLPA